MTKPELKHKYVFIVTLLFIVFCVSYTAIVFHQPTPQIVARQIEEKINKIDNTLTQKLGDFAQTIGNTTQYPSYETLSSYGFDNDEFTYLVFRDDSLVFWSDNYFPIDAFPTDMLCSYHIHRASNGWYMSRCLPAGAYSVVGLFLIKNEFAYENEFLNNTLSYRLSSQPVNLELNSEQNLHNIHDSNGSFLFSLEFAGQKTVGKSAQTILFALYLLCIIWLSASLRLIINTFLLIRFNPLIRFVAFAAVLVLCRYLAFITQIPAVFHTLDIFAPQHFASSVLVPSLADLIINTLCVVILMMFFINDVLAHNNTQRNTIAKRVLLFLTPVLSVLLFYGVCDIFRKMVFHSDIYLLFSNISEFTVYSFWAVGVMFLVVVTASFAVTALVKFAGTCFTRSSKSYMWLVLSFVGAALPVLFVQTPLGLYVTVIVLFFTGVVYYYNLTEKNNNVLNVPVAYIVIFAMMTVFFIYTFSKEKEIEKRKILTVSLSSETDPIGEYLYSEMSEDIIADTTLKRMLQKHIENEPAIVRHLKSVYFNGYWAKYDIQITVCAENDELLLKPDNLKIKCADLFEGIKFNTGKPAGVANLYQLNQSAGRASYLAELPLQINDTGLVKTLYIELLSKFAPKQLGYPELLMDKSIRTNKAIESYNYARYRNNELVAQYGKYFYFLNSNDYNTGDSAMYFFDLNGYNHLYYKIDESSELIISKKNYELLDYAASFSYVFIIFALLWLVIKYLALKPPNVKKLSISFSGRVRLALIAVVLISFVSIGIVTLRFIVSIYNNKNYDNISEKAHSLLIEIENKLARNDSFSPALTEYANELLVKFSNIFFTDINLFGLDGRLIASSRNKVFTEGLISGRMNAEAFHHMTNLRKTFYIHEEQIGSLKFLSAYVPFRNYNNKCIAYINLPYFAKQSEQRKEITTFLAAFINIYVFLIAISTILAVLISRYVAKPLKLIKDKLSRFQLGKNNEKIVWKQEDEIGSLVAEYNRLIDELAHSVELLAQSERESAWREMAKQVAHEIKNPLTPMKLSVQHLQRSLGGSPEEIEEKLNRFANNMITQIDTLSSIATSFSDFARMPDASDKILDIEPLLKQCVDVYTGITTTQIKVQHKNQETLQVLADDMQLRRAFDNILRNAMQAIESNQNGLIEIITETHNNTCIIAFRDNGKGISEDEAKKIFIPNFTTKTSGMGLGLAIVKNTIERFGGGVSFESKLGTGTTFWVTLPLHNRPIHN